MSHSSVQFSRSVVSDSLRPHESQHARPPSPSPTPGVHPNSCASSQWCHPAISSSVIPFSSCPQSLPASGSFPMSQFFASGGQSIGVSASASVLLMNTQDWSPLGWTDWISLQSKGLSRVFSNTTVQFPFISLIFLCDTFAYSPSCVLFHPPLALGSSRSGGPCCVLCLNFQLLIGSEMDIWPEGDSSSKRPIRNQSCTLENVN